MQASDITKNLETSPTRSEGYLTKVIEGQTSKLPSVFFLSLAIASMGISAVLSATERDSGKGWANFVGHWAPTILVLGLYNKLTKLEGSEGRTLH